MKLASQMNIRQVLVLVALVVLSVGQIPFVITSFEIDGLLPHTVLFVPIEIALCFVLVLSELFRPFSGRYIAIFLLSLVALDGLVSYFVAFHFFNPFNDTQYVKVLPKSGDTIRFQNRDWFSVIVSALLCLVYLFNVRKQGGA